MKMEENAKRKMKLKVKEKIILFLKKNEQQFNERTDSTLQK